eukprot:gene38477-47517_t
MASPQSAWSSRYRDKLGEIKATTDAKGQFSITWPAAGMYWVDADVKDDKTSIPQAKERRLSYVGTLEHTTPQSPRIRVRYGAGCQPGGLPAAPLASAAAGYATGPSYQRLLGTIRRLSSGTIEVYSQRFDKGCSTRLIAGYEYSKDEQKPWTVKVFDKEDRLLFLFERMYSRIDWETRLALPEGVATWLHAYFSTHQEPYAHKLETLLRGAGIEALVSVGFLKAYDISKTGLTRRSCRLRYRKRSRTGVVIGGGLLGLECAKALRDMNLDTHVVEFSPRLMAVQVDDGGARVLRSKIE